ncbi:MAG TPA: hypothetical protein PLD25_18415 [Chloroflexota bacterium]|nr:hypothetical protein [Chloroflexota bacterium]
MNEKIYLRELLSESTRTAEENLELFALLNLGVLESLSHGLLSASEALRTFFHAENSLFVREELHHRLADEIMSRGVQLPDLFEILPTEEAQREFQREMAKLHALCLDILEQKLVAA